MATNIIGGLVSGVATGLVLAAFFWAVDRYRQHSERKEQIQYLAGLISTCREQMHKPMTSIDQQMQTFAGKEAFRKMTYGQMEEKINSALEGRCSRISFDEIRELRGNVDIWGKISEVWEDKNEGLSDKYCEIIFGRFESIKWLNLPK